MYIARVWAASLPLGSIMPYMRSVMVIFSPANSWAEVPHRISVVLGVRTATLTLSGSTLYCSSHCMVTQDVITLVRLATYLTSCSFFA